MYEYPRHAGKKVILCMQVLFSHERNRSINQIRESLWASGRSSEWQRAEKKRKDARTFYEKERERERRENEKREERYSNFVPSLAPKISMCNNLSSGPAEVSGRTIPTTCMHNLCRWFSRKRTGPKEERVAPYQDRILHLSDLSLKM